eukprot:1832906-Amphidinium_carterae.2
MPRKIRGSGGKIAHQYGVAGMHTSANGVPGRGASALTSLHSMHGMPSLLSKRSDVTRTPLLHMLTLIMN